MIPETSRERLYGGGSTIIGGPATSVAEDPTEAGGISIIGTVSVRDPVVGQSNPLVHQSLPNWNCGDADSAYLFRSLAISSTGHTEGMTSRGVVHSWDVRGMRGVINSADTPGGCWTYYSALHPDEVINSQPGESFSIGGGIRGLDVGEQVDFEWERVIDQDGYKFRAIRVRPRREIPPWRVERSNS